MSFNHIVHNHETLEWIVWFSELPTRVSWQMIKDALKMRVSRGVRNVRHGGPRFISADVGSPDNGKRLFDEIARSGIEGLEECSFTIAWGYVVRGAKVIPVKFEESTYRPHRSHGHPYRAAISSQSPFIRQLQAPTCAQSSHPSSDLTPTHLGGITMSRCISISGFPSSMTSTAAEQLLSHYGHVVMCQVESPSECQVEFKYAGDAQNVAKLFHEQWINGSRLLVRFNPTPISQDLQTTWRVQHCAENVLEAQHQNDEVHDLSSCIDTRSSLDRTTRALIASTADMSCSHATSPTPLTDAEGRSIVGYSGIKSKRRKTIAAGHCNHADSDSENDMSH